MVSEVGVSEPVEELVQLLPVLSMIFGRSHLMTILVHNAVMNSIPDTQIPDKSKYLTFTFLVFK